MSWFTKIRDVVTAPARVLVGAPIAHIANVIAPHGALSTKGSIGHQITATKQDAIHVAEAAAVVGGGALLAGAFAPTALAGEASFAGLGATTSVGSLVTTADGVGTFAGIAGGGVDASLAGAGIFSTLASGAGDYLGATLLPGIISGAIGAKGAPGGDPNAGAGVMYSGSSGSGAFDPGAAGDPGTVAGVNPLVIVGLVGIGIAAVLHAKGKI